MHSGVMQRQMHRGTNQSRSLMAVRCSSTSALLSTLNTRPSDSRTTPTCNRRCAFSMTCTWWHAARSPSTMSTAHCRMRVPRSRRP